MEPKNGRKTKLIVLALIVVAAVAAYMWWQGQQSVPASTTSESLSGMQSAATSVDTGNLDQEFDSINKDLNTL